VIDISKCSQAWIYL